jgi:hypothetical protein
LPRPEVGRLIEEFRPIHWHLAFPNVSHGFDLVLGNPPFVNAIEGGIDPRTRRITRRRFPQLSGTADHAFEFLALAAEIASPTGRVAMVQPRSVLNAPAARRLRRELMATLPPSMIFVPRRADHFGGAAVYVCLLSLARERQHPTRLAIADEPESARWHDRSVDEENWWSVLLAAEEGVRLRSNETGNCLARDFELSASMTAGDAYDLRPFISDSPRGRGQKLVTTGLIDPGLCAWGKVACRYLKTDYAFPRIVECADMSASLRRRLARSRRPKIIVAGLSKRIECFLDEYGECAGAVSTFSIYHPADSVAALRSLCAMLLTEEASTRFRLELGGNALGGGNTTMKKTFLASLPIDG